MTAEKSALNGSVGPDLDKAYTKSSSEVLKSFGVTQHGGLNDVQVDQQRRKWGRNGGC